MVNTIEEKQRRKLECSRKRKKRQKKTEVR